MEQWSWQFVESVWHFGGPVIVFVSSKRRFSCLGQCGCEISKNIFKGFCIIGRRGGLWISKIGVEHVSNSENPESLKLRVRNRSEYMYGDSETNGFSFYR